jgi:PqqD family protein of HPr-rel-A system
MTTAQIPKPTGAFEGTDLGDEYLFYDRENDRVHVLNTTAREIFLLCDGKRSEEEIAGNLAETYDLDSETATRDTRQTLERLYELGVLES